MELVYNYDNRNRFSGGGSTGLKYMVSKNLGGGAKHAMQIC